MFPMKWDHLIVAVIVVLMTATWQQAAAQHTDPHPPTPPTTQPTTQPQETRQPAPIPNSDAIERQLLNQLDANPVVQPTNNQPKKPADPQGPPSIGTPNVDPRVLGVAPDQKRPKLRREGEFIVNRRGRLMMAPNGHQVLFTFEADSNTSPEPPMVLSNCQMLQNMEEIIHERGDRVVFIISGQVLAYRGLNYLLPTMMRLAIDHGNLDP